MRQQKQRPFGYRSLAVLLFINVLTLVFLHVVVERPFSPSELTARLPVRAGFFAGLFFMTAVVLCLLSPRLRRELSKGEPASLVVASSVWWVLALLYYSVLYITLSRYQSIVEPRAAGLVILSFAGAGLLVFFLSRVLKNRLVIQRPTEYLFSLPFFLLLPAVYIAGSHHQRPFSLLIVQTYLMAGAGVFLFGVLFLLGRTGLSRPKREHMSLGLVILFTGTAVGASLEKGQPAVREYKAQRLTNVIILSVDTLRQDVLGCYGSREGLTPAIDGLAKDGIVFRNAYSPSPWTLPSFGTAFTGLYPTVHGGGRLEPGEEMEEARPASTRVTYLAQILKGAGYHTAAFYTNTWLSPHQNINRGFQTYVRLDVEKLKPYSVFHPGTAFRLLRRVLHKDLHPISFNQEEPQQKWISYYYEEPMFLWVHFLDPHLPYDMHPELENFYKGFSQAEKELADKINRERLRKLEAGSRPGRKTLYRLYQGEVKYVDSRLSRVLTLLKRAGLYKDSLIFFLSDHGEEFWDHQGFEHGHTQYNELIRVPLIVKLPGNRYAGKTFYKNVGLVDITPTVLDYLDIKYKGAMQGTSLLRRLRRNHGKGTTTYFSQFTLYGAEEQAVIESGHKLMLRRGKPIYYFNLENEPKEKDSLLTSRPEKTASLYEKYQRWESSCHELKETLRGDFQEKPREWDPAEKKALRDLGYLE